MYQVYFLYRRFRFIIIVSFFLLSACGSSEKGKSSPGNSHAIVTLQPLVVRSLPHDNQAFTQGLLFDKGKIYESTGIRGKSSLRSVQADNGTVLRHILLPDVFAEGIVLKDKALLQLTWQSGIAILYAYPELERIGTLSYEGEGWGITTDGVWYLMSNGSDTLYRRDNTFTIRKKTAVTLRGRPLTRLNELEYARGKLYANVWYSDCIFEIDISNGRVIRIIDCSNLVQQAGPLGEEAVLNGIAYNREKDTFFCTGKNWPVMFEVKIPES